MSRVLLAEDDSDLRSVLAEILRGGGFEVDEAPLGDMVLERLCADTLPDAIVLDLGMPGMTGQNVLAARHTISQAAESVPVIVITGDAHPHVEGVTTVLQKPFECEDLLGALRGVLRT